MTAQELERLATLADLPVGEWTLNDFDLFVRRYNESTPDVKAKVRQVLGMKDREAS